MESPQSGANVSHSPRPGTAGSIRSIKLAPQSSKSSFSCASRYRPRASIPSPSFVCVYATPPANSAPAPVSALPASHRPPSSRLGTSRAYSDTVHSRRPSSISRTRSASVFASSISPVLASDSSATRNASVLTARSTPYNRATSWRAPPAAINMWMSVFTSPSGSVNSASPQPAPSRPHTPSPGRTVQCAYGMTLVNAVSIRPRSAAVS